MEKEVEAVIESIRRNPNWGHADTWKALDALDRSLAKPGDTSTGEMMSDEVLTPEQHRDVVRLIHRETECLHDQGNEFVARHIKFNKKLVDHDTLLDVQAKLLSLTHPKTVDRIRNALMREEWQKATDGGQNERALARLVDEAVQQERRDCRIDILNGCGQDCDGLLRIQMREERK